MNPELIAKVLSARLHRQVNVAELGFAGHDGERDGLLFPSSVHEAVETAAALWRRFGRRGRPTTVAPFVTAAAIEAGWRWHFDPPDSTVARPTQAVFLDLPGEAVRLSRAATDGAGRRPVASVSARLLSSQATAHAVAGDLQAFRTTIGRAEHALNRADGTGPSWARYFSPAHLAGSAMRSLLDLGRPEEALTFHEQVMDLAPGNARTRALHTALTATAYAQAGRIDAAAHLALKALALAQRIRSERVQARITLLASALAPHRPVPEVAAFLEQAAAPK